MPPVTIPCILSSLAARINLSSPLASKKRRVLLHYTHKQTLGHTTRTISLATAIINHKTPKNSLLVLQGGAPQPLVEHPKGYGLLNIPFPFDTRASFRSRSIPQRTPERAAFILNAARQFAPDIFITEFFPFGRSAYIPELLPALRQLRKSGCRIIASIGYPLIIDLIRLQDKQFAAIYKALLSFYDAFLIHTPAELETPYFARSITPTALADLYKATLKSIEKKIIYTGYIFPEQTLTPSKDPGIDRLAPAANTVIVSRGGGAVYPKLIINAIRAQKILGKAFRTIIACGPSTSAEETALFKSVLKETGSDRILLTPYLSDLNEHLRTCQVSVSLSGYNTSVQLMRYGTPAIIVPYRNGLSQMPTNDQIARADLLKEKFASIILSHDALTPQSLAWAIRARAEQPRPAPAPAAWFQGARTSARVILEGA